jgi:hypothetical protein
MELAVHFRDLTHARALNDLPGHMSILYGEKAVKGLDWSAWIDQSSWRLYIGDEFCIHRLPSLYELDALCQLAKRENRGLSFLTPPLTDDGIDRCGPLFDILKGMDLGTEVVVNDWGVLLFLKEKYPSFQLSVGRLLNKGFKDPRLTNPDEATEFSAETAELFNTCTFDSNEFPAKMRQLNVKRLERDLFPFGEPEIKQRGGLQTSVYFPFGYITTGRMCWMSSFHCVAGRKFSMFNGCRQTCQKISLKLNHAKTDLQLFQTGNTIFYLYAPSKLAVLVKQAKTQKLRLVYQGLMV